MVDKYSEGRFENQEMVTQPPEEGLNSNVKVKGMKTSLVPHPTPQLCL